MIYIVFVLAMLLFSACDISFSVFFEDDDFHSLRVKGNTVRGIIYSCIMFLASYLLTSYVLGKDSIIIASLFCLIIGIILFVINFFVLKSKQVSFYVVPYVIVAEFVLQFAFRVYEKEDEVIGLIMYLKIIVLSLAAIILLLLAYGIIKQKISVSGMGKTLTFVMKMVSGTVYSVFLAFLFQSCVTNVLT